MVYPSQRHLLAAAGSGWNLWRGRDYIIGQGRYCPCLLAAPGFTGSTLRGRTAPRGCPDVRHFHATNLSRNVGPVLFLARPRS